MTAPPAGATVSRCHCGTYYSAQPMNEHDPAPQPREPRRLNIHLPPDLRRRVDAARMPGESTVQAIRRMLHAATSPAAVGGRGE